MKIVENERNAESERQELLRRVRLKLGPVGKLVAAVIGWILLPWPLGRRREE